MEKSELPSFGAELLSKAELISEDLIGWRRDFHLFPELAFEEKITASKIKNILSGIPNISVETDSSMPTCVTAVIGRDIPGPAIMLRATMDAIPADEQTGLPFASCLPGVFHAAGHDAGMASLLGAAFVLSEYEDVLPNRVVCLFQPAGEGRSGARNLVNSGFVERYNIGTAVAVNWSPELPYGNLCTRRGVMTALSDRIHIDVRGTAGHAAEPHMTVDPVTIAAQIIISIQTMLAREVDPRDPVVVSFGQIDSGAAYNAIPEQANLWGTLRAFSPDVRDFVQKRIETVAPAIASAFRGLASVEYTRNYAQVENTHDMIDKIYNIGLPFFGEDGIELLERPLLSGEDFSFFSTKIPSIFMLLGTGLEFPVHHPRYDTPESMLPFAAAWQAYVACTLNNDVRS